MADLDYDDDYGAPLPPPRRGRRWVNVAGAATSAALALGAVLWGYKIAVRNVAGVPVIRAIEGPMRVAPENPGGEQAEHQGLSVNDVAAVGVATPVPDQIVLAPRPDTLTEDDTAGLAPEPPAEMVAPPLPEAPVQPLLPEPGAEPAVVPLETAPLPDLPQPDAGLADPETALLPPEPVPEPVAEPFVPPPVVPGGLGRSLRPVPRPGGLAVLPVAAPEVALRRVDPGALAPGARLVQFGAFDSEAQALEYWDKLLGTFGELFSGKGQVVQSAVAGGRTFYRLRAEGFADEADARRFCAAVTAVGPECIPVVHR